MQGGSSTVPNWVWTCRGVKQFRTGSWTCRGVKQFRTGCGHTGELNSSELGVDMQGGSSTVPNWVWTCRGGVRQSQIGCGHGGGEFDSRSGHAGVEFDSLELGLGMQGWSSTVSNWVWACKGGVRQSRTGSGHAGGEFDSPVLGQGGEFDSRSGHTGVEFDSLELGLGMQGGSSTIPELGLGMQGGVRQSQSGENTPP